MGHHSSLGTGDIHYLHNWTYASAALRTAASNFVAADVGKVAKQTSDSSWWLLTDNTGPTWNELTGTGVPGAHASTHSEGGSDEVLIENLGTGSTTTNHVPIGNGAGGVSMGYIAHADASGQTADDHHAQSHTIASHSDTTATGAELETLTDDSMADALHRHSELSASDGTPNPAVSIDAAGDADFTGKIDTDDTITVENTGSPTVQAKYTGGPNAFLYSDVGNTYVGSSTNHPLLIQVNTLTGIEIDTSQNVNIPNGDLDVQAGNIAVSGTVDGVDVGAHAADVDAHHAQAHTIASHSDTTATGAGLNTLTDGSEAYALHHHDKLASTLSPSGTTQTIDWDNGDGQALDLGAASSNVALTMTNAIDGASYMLKIIQGASLVDVSLASNVILPGETLPTTLNITEVDDAVDALVLYYDGAQYLANFTQNYG